MNGTCLSECRRLREVPLRGAPPSFFALLRSNYTRRGIHLFINHDKDAFYDPPVS